MDPIARGHQGAAKIKSRLCSVGGFNPDEWELPPKPKWMRWKTYNRMVEKFDRHEAMVEESLAEAIMRLGLPLG
jgi:myo-inositol catabolism protein IolC